MRIGLNHSRLALTLALIAGVSVLLVSATNTYAQCQTFTTEADFSAGVFFNIDNDTLGGGQLH
ncbi:MAG TPA: hypothetical protein VLB27_03910, partial [candidate division Zixibacteria bacterium]|nr:hypothetical protein [candidate division Zixibacteria bacterium]